MTKTAIQWFTEQMEQRGEARETPALRIVQFNIDTSEYLEIKREAERMFEKQIVESNYDGQRLHAKSVTDSMMKNNGEAYYTETYGIVGHPNPEINHVVDTNEMVSAQTDENGKPLTYWGGVDFSNKNAHLIKSNSTTSNQKELVTLLNQAYQNITRRKGEEYAPTVVEIQIEIDKIKKDMSLKTNGNNSENCQMLEISDEEIEKFAEEFTDEYYKVGVTEWEVSAFVMGMKKYREQLKNKI